MAMLGDGTVIRSVHRGAGGGLLRVVATAQTNARIAQLMSELSKSPYFERTNLLDVRRKEGDVSDFQFELGLRCDAATQTLRDGQPLNPPG